MSNMSYCRFENTARDLADCQEALEELFDGSAEPLSASELAAAKDLVSRCLAIALNTAEAAGVDIEDLDKAHAEDGMLEALVSANATTGAVSAAGWDLERMNAFLKRAGIPEPGTHCAAHHQGASMNASTEHSLRELAYTRKPDGLALSRALEAMPAGRERNLAHALGVMVLDQRIRGWLQVNDPKALEQAERALAEVADAQG